MIYKDQFAQPPADDYVQIINPLAISMDYAGRRLAEIILKHYDYRVQVSDDINIPATYYLELMVCGIEKWQRFKRELLSLVDSNLNPNYRLHQLKELLKNFESIEDGITTTRYT